MCPTNQSIINGMALCHKKAGGPWCKQTPKNYSFNPLIGKWCAKLKIINWLPMLQYFSLVMKSEWSTYNIVSYVVKAFHATYPALWYKIINNNESCWQNAAEMWAQVRTLENNTTELKLNFIIQEMTSGNQHSVRSRHQNLNGSVFIGDK